MNPLNPWREDLYGELGDLAFAWLIAENLTGKSITQAWLARKLAA